MWVNDTEINKFLDSKQTIYPSQLTRPSSLAKIMKNNNSNANITISPEMASVFKNGEFFLPVSPEFAFLLSIFLIME